MSQGAPAQSAQQAQRQKPDHSVEDFDDDPRRKVSAKAQAGQFQLPPQSNDSLAQQKAFHHALLAKDDVGAGVHPLGLSSLVITFVGFRRPGSAGAFTSTTNRLTTAGIAATTTATATTHASTVPTANATPPSTAAAGGFDATAAAVATTSAGSTATDTISAATSARTAANPVSAATRPNTGGSDAGTGRSSATTTNSSMHSAP